MIERKQFGFLVTCDCIGCANQIEVDTHDHDFKEVLIAMDHEGWRSDKNRKTDEWDHTCKECVYES